MECVKVYIFCSLYVTMYWVNEYQFITFKGKIIRLECEKILLHTSKILVTEALHKFISK